MATVATARTPITFDGYSLLGIGTPIVNRFPTPPTAWGFAATAINPDTDDVVWDPDILGLEPPYFFADALTPGPGRYMEKRKGQIWPR